MLDALDTVLDRTMVLGYTWPGYKLRRRGWTEHGRLPRLDGHTVALTGGTSGLGQATAGGLVDLGARVLLLVRSSERGERLAGEINHRAGNGDRVRVFTCDLSDLASVRRCAEALLDSGESIDVLINNAGVMAAERSLSTDGIELTFATNVVGPFLLTNLLEPALAAAAARTPAHSRVITVSSGGMYGQRIHVDDLQMEHVDYSGVTAYARSKRAEVILTEQWSERWRDERIGVHAMHPGWVDTPGVQEFLPRFRALTSPLLRDPDQGADTTLWLAGTDPAALGTGGFWHDRRRRPTHLVPKTQETRADRALLWLHLCELSGWSDPRTTEAAIHAVSDAE